MTKKISNIFCGKSQANQKQGHSKSNVQFDLNNLVISNGEPCILPVLN